jgi:hypothetical protein
MVFYQKREMQYDMMDYQPSCGQFRIRTVKDGYGQTIITGYAGLTDGQ